MSLSCFASACRRIDSKWRNSSYCLLENARATAGKSSRVVHTIMIAMSFLRVRLTSLALVAISSAAIQTTFAQLPPGWMDEDIGAPSLAGSASYSAGNWSVAGGGADIWNAADQFHFAFTNATGSTVIIARVLSLDETDPWAKAGVMIRDDDTPGAMFADVVVTPASGGNGVNFQWRDSTGGQCGYSQVGGIAAPIWLKLVRNGTDFAGFYSPDGAAWTPIGPDMIIPMGNPGLAGLAVTAHNDAALCNASFASVTVSNAPPPPPPLGGMFRELWTGLTTSLGNTLTALTNTTYNPNWPNNPNPTYTRVFTNFETEINSGKNNYGERARAFVIPPTNGNYIFWISSDDSSALMVSTDETPAHRNQIAGVAAWTNSREWGKEAGQQSSPVSLEGGRRYYVEALMQQGSGGDNLAVRWQLPNGTIEEPLTATSPAGTLLIPYDGIDLTPGIYSQSSNTTAVEATSVSFSVLVTNRSSVTYQWQVNGVNAPGPNGAKPFYSVSNLSIALNNGQVYTCVVSNSAGAITSSPIVLNVIADTVPPTVTRALNLGSTNVQVVFSEGVELASATAVTNYVFTNGLPITAASLSSDNLTVTLTTASLVYGSNYTVTINNVRDRASNPNTIAANTKVSFTATPYASQDIGGAPGGSSVTVVGSNGLNVTAAGSDLGGNADQCNFQYQLLNGDFDISARVAGLSPADVWAKAGLMARETLDPGSRFAASLTTPAMNGTFFESRLTTSGASASAGSFPANYPNTYLRLKRTGALFTGYAGFDGQTWTQLGTVSIAMPAQIYFGFVVSSHSSSQTTTAQFRDQSNVVGGTIATVTSPYETLGPSSRKSPIAITEIMYKPAPRADTNNLEFLELYNSNPWFHDLSGYQIVGDSMSYTFPPGTVIPGGAFIVVAASPQSIQNVYGVAGAFGPYTGSLKKSGTIQLLDEQSAVLLTIPYSNTSPWPAGADATGHSLILARPTFGEGDPRAWDISDVVGGSPGQMEAFRPSPLRNVVINEFLAHTDPPDYDYIELYNHANTAVDISGCILTDDSTTNKFVVPPGTFIPARGFVFYSETNMNFRLSALGETIYFKNPDQSRYLDVVHFGDQENGVSSGRWPDGAAEFYRLAAKTPGAPNGSIRLSDIVINELMYDPITGDDNLQYVELYNRGTNTVNLDGWSLDDSISFTFPTNTLMAPGSYLVIARNASLLRSNYANLNLSNCLGDFSGKLSHNGEHLSLKMPDTTMTTNSQGIVTTNLIHIAVNDLTYSSGGRWGQWAAGGGSSLELLDPNSNNRLAANWGDSDETQKSVWTNIETVAVLDNGANYESSILHAQIGLLDVGECLIDNVEVRAGSGTNLVLNSDFETGGLANWQLQGDHFRSSLENTGYLSSAHSLHVRCSDRIWTGDNSCQMTLATNSMAQGQTATLRFKARWLRGWPEPLLRLNGNWLEATGALPLPSNLGTPGARNSRYITNAGPAIYQVTHSPSVPGAGQAIVVTARVHDPNAIQTFTVFYRVDPSTGYTPVTMRDDGAGGDAIASDGLFSATLPGQASGTIIAFYLQASDATGAVSRFPALVNDNAPVRECVVRFGDANPAGSFGVYHLWITQTNVTRWSQLSDLSNETHDGTFVNGTRVIYNMQGRFAGSPYHQGFDTPSGNLCHYKWIFPDDDAFLGATSFNKIHQPGNGAGDDASIQREQLANSFLRALGVPWLNRRYVAVYVNGSRRGTLMEDTQTPDADVVKEHFPNDSGGWLYKMQPWFEFGPTPTGASIPFNNVSWCNIMPYTTTGGVKKTARYRYNFMVRRTPGSASDYTPVFSLVDAASTYGTPNYVANMQNMADMENWMRVFAGNHAAGNWDAFGCQNAQNLYGYMGAGGTKYSLLMFDFNIVIGNSGSWGPGQNLFSVNGQDPNTQNIYNEPTFRRMYWRALQELVNGPLTVANSGPLLDAKFNAFAANGLNVENPNAAIKSWLSQAHDSIASQIAVENTAGFSVSASVTVSNDMAYITGTAPVNVKTIWINGVEYAVTWTSVTSWRVAVPLHPGSNTLNVTGIDIHGQPVPGATGSVSATYSGTPPSPVGQIVINEIMYQPPTTGSEFVEFYNNSSNYTFDISGWQVNGLSYTFPTGSVIWPRSFLVLAANRAAFAAAYGATNPVFDVFSGSLQNNGETLALIQPGTNAASNVVVSKVRYGTSAPWPSAPGNGNSLQLVDPRQDNWREGNWLAAIQTNSGYATPQWVFVTTNVPAASTRFYVYLQSAGDIYVDDVSIVGAGGTNLLADGDFESTLTGPWNLTANFSGSSISTAVKHSGNSSLHVVATAAGTGSGNAIFQDFLANGANVTISFWYLQSTNGGPLTMRLSSSSNPSTVNPAPPFLPAQTAATPGATNSVFSQIAPFQPLWINEVQADNLTGITNRAGQHTAWIEIFNPSSTNVSLTNLYLANNYTNLAQWAFPAGAVINSHQFKVVFVDGQTALTTASEWHANFALSSGSGSIVLSRLTTNSLLQVLDYVDYTNLGVDLSYGSFPDAQIFDRQAFLHVTPGATNDGSTFIAYNTPGSIYSQNFNSLPNPGPTSVNAANPVTINGITYSLPNPYDFGIPSVPSGQNGGLGLAPLAGWYGLADSGSGMGPKFGATDGDQTTGGQISFGPANSTNRALGLLATSSTGFTAFGAKFVNRTAQTLNYVNVQITGELWRQSDRPKLLQCYYRIDATGTNAFSTNLTALLPALNVSFPTDGTATGGVAVDGTSAPYQTNLAIANQSITAWPPGAALWLVWEMADPTARAQGLGIDNLSFSASATASANTAPTLGAISNRTVTLGQTLLFTASATDTDQPPQTLTFSLAAGAPAGATINSSSGQFSWKPSTAPATNSIGVVVTDSGTPSLSATQTFTVTVTLPPQFTSTTLTGNQFKFSWFAANGAVYQVEYKDALTNPTWSALGSAVNGNGSVVTVTNLISASSQRFFRLRVLPP